MDLCTSAVIGAEERRYIKAITEKKSFHQNRRGSINEEPSEDATDVQHLSRVPALTPASGGSL